MELLTELLKILLTISNTLIYPVIIGLVVLIFVVLMMIGSFLSEYSQRSNNLDDKIKRGNLQRFYRRLKTIKKKYKPGDTREIEIERLIQNHEIEFERKIEKTRLLIRIGPILGLMGTLIPMGPALIGLGSGNIAEMANQLVIAFTSTVIGLFIGGIALVITSIRRRWYLEDMKDIEYISEKFSAENKLIGEKK
jgi:biopolymer transport protein ExbB/TolQ